MIPNNITILKYIGCRIKNPEDYLTKVIPGSSYFIQKEEPGNEEEN